MTTNMVDYRNTVFEHPTVTKIHGEPTFEGIRTIHKELMINAQTVYSDLGGGAHGHLGLVLSPRRYALLSNADYVRPQHPGQLVIPPGTTQHMVRTLKDQHEQRLKTFKEMTNVENSLKQQLVAAVEPQYIQALRDITTGKLIGTIAQVIKHLYDVYGRVTPQALYEQEQRVHQMVYDPGHPIDGVFSAVDELANYAEAAQTPYSQPQCINLAYRILNRSGLFQRWILDWNAKPHVQKNWANFKSHFRKAHQQLKETSNLQVQDSTYHANAIKELLQELRTEIRANPSVQNEIEPAPSLSTLSNNSSDSNISALQTEVASLKDYIHNMQQSYHVSQPPPPFYPPPAWNQSFCLPVNLYQAYAHQASTYPIQQQFAKQQFKPTNNNKRRKMYYCWTHGACFHPGQKCRNKVAGHQDNATFQDRMGGSIKNVRGIPQQADTQST